MKVWHFEWGNGDFVCREETLQLAAGRVAEIIVKNGEAPFYGNDFNKVYEALVSEGVEVKEFQTLYFADRDAAKAIPK